MITFKSFLNENTSDVLELEEGLNQIGSKCRPFLDASRGIPAFRGIRQLSKVMFTKHPRKRKPVDSDDSFNFMFNAMIEAAFVIPEVRTRTIFITGRSKQASNYGQVSFCFPVGDMQFLWSDKIYDSFESTSVIYSHLKKNLSTQTPLIANRGLSMLFESLAKMSSAYDWVNDHNATAVKETNAAFIDSIGSPQDVLASTDETAYEQLFDALKRTAKELYVESRDLPGALKSGNEILLFKSEGYYSVPITLVYDMIQENDKDLHSHIMNQREPEKHVYEFLLKML